MSGPRDVLYRSEVSVSGRPSSLAAVYRPAWRVPITALLVGACRQERARREQLIVLNWAIRSERGASLLAEFMNGRVRGHEVGVRYEPALVRAVNIAVGSGVLAAAGDWMKLTDAGRTLVTGIIDHDLYEQERGMLSTLPKPLSFKAAEELLKGRP